MRYKQSSSFQFACLLLLVTAQSHAAVDLVELKHNPFAQPEIKAKPVPRKSRSNPARALGKVSIDLEATLVSTNGSMVIANGQLISIGEKIGDMTLIAVGEGEAVFARGLQKLTYRVSTITKD